MDLRINRNNGGELTLNLSAGAGAFVVPIADLICAVSALSP